MATVNAQIRWAANVDELKANLQQGIGVVDAMKSSVDRTVQSLSGNGLLQAANKVAAAILQMSDGMNVASGTMRLTEAEQNRVNALMGAALEKYEALGLQAPPALQQVSTAITENRSAWESFSEFFQTFTGQYLEARLIWDAAREAYRKLTEFVTSSIQAYADAETAQRRLTVALQTQGLAIPGLNQQYLDLARRYQETTVYSHTTIEAAEALFVQLGNVGPGMMDRALQAATDLASGLGMDLQSAVQLLSRAAEGQTQTFSRYGIVLDQARVKSEGFGYVLDAVEAKVGGQAQAELDTYAGKMKQLGNAWTDTKEAIGNFIVQDPIVQAALQAMVDRTKETKDKTDETHKSMTDWAADLVGIINPALRDYVAAQKEAAEDINAFNGAVKAIPPIQSKLPPLDFLDQLRNKSKEVVAQVTADAKAQQKATEEAAKAFQSAVKSEVNALDGADLAKKVNVLAGAVQALGGVSHLTQPELQKVGNEAADLAKKGAVLTPQLQAIAIAFNGFLKPAKDGIENMKGFGEAVKLVIPSTAAADDAIAKLSDKVKDGVSGLGNIGFKVTSGFGEAVKGAQEAQKAADQAARRTEQDIQELARSFDVLGSAIGGNLGTAISDFGHLISAVDAAEKAFSKMGEAPNLLSKISLGVSGIVGIVSAAIPVITGLWNHLFGTAGRDAVTQFADSMGGFDALHQKLDGLGASGEQLWVNLTQGVGRNNPQQAQAAIDAITKALDNQKQADDALNQSQNQQISNLITKIQGLGGAIDPALDGYIQKLKDANLLTGANADALKQLESGGVPSYDTLTQLQQKYNLTLDQMGPSFQAADLNSRFQALIDDMDTLQRGGVNVNAALVTVGSNGQAALSDLGKSVQGVIDDAMKYGIAIPQNMKPAAQALIDQGLLLDANGQKITDINQLKFGDDMQTTLSKLNDTLKDLIEAIGTKLPQAISNVPKSVDIDFNAKYTGFPDGSSVPGAATGGVVGYGNVIPFPTEYRAMGGPIGSDTVHVMATPGEIILNAAQQGRVAGALGGAGSDALLEEIRGLRQDLRTAAGGEGDTYVYIDGQRQDAKTIKKVRQLAARGGFRTRAATGRSY